VLRLCFRMESNAPVLGQTNLAPKYLTTSTPRLVVNDGQNAVAAPVFPCAILPRSQPHLRFHFSCNHSVHTSSSPSSPSKRRKSKQKEKLTECSSDGCPTPPSVSGSPRQNRRGRKRKIHFHNYIRQEVSSTRPQSHCLFSSGDFSCPREGRGRARRRMLSVSLPNFPFQCWPSVDFEVMIRTYSSQLRYTMPHTIEISPSSSTSPVQRSATPSPCSSSKISTPVSSPFSSGEYMGFSCSATEPPCHLVGTSHSMSMECATATEANFSHDEIFSDDTFGLQPLFSSSLMNDDFSMSNGSSSEIMMQQYPNHVPSIYSQPPPYVPTSEDSEAMVGTVSSGVVSSDESGTTSPETRPSPVNAVAHLTI
jgi:hypothetical protein